MGLLKSSIYFTPLSTSFIAVYLFDSESRFFAPTHTEVLGGLVAAVLLAGVGGQSYGGVDYRGSWRQDWRATSELTQPEHLGRDRSRADAAVVAAPVLSCPHVRR
jgi:hypothetical protein